MVGSGDDDETDECHLYTVLLNTDESESDEEMTDRLLFDVPRRGMKFIDLPYQSDQNLKAAYSDTTRLVYAKSYIWPENWKDLKETTDHT